MFVSQYLCTLQEPSPPVQFPTYSPTVTQEPTTSTLPTYHPTVTQEPTTTPQPSVFTGNTIGWVDVDNYGCDWNEAYDYPGCPHFGHLYEGDMGVANDNCCFCEGTGVSVIARNIP